MKKNNKNLPLSQKRPSRKDNVNTYNFDFDKAIVDAKIATIYHFAIYISEAVDDCDDILKKYNLSVYTRSKAKKLMEAAEDYIDKYTSTSEVADGNKLINNYEIIKNAINRFVLGVENEFKYAHLLSLFNNQGNLVEELEINEWQINIFENEGKYSYLCHKHLINNFPHGENFVSLEQAKNVAINMSRLVDEDDIITQYDKALEERREWEQEVIDNANN